VTTIDAKIAMGEAIGTSMSRMPCSRTRPAWLTTNPTAPTATNFWNRCASVHNRTAESDHDSTEIMRGYLSLSRTQRSRCTAGAGDFEHTVPNAPVKPLSANHTTRNEVRGTPDGANSPGIWGILWG